MSNRSRDFQPQRKTAPPSEIGQDQSLLWPWMDPEILATASSVATTNNQQVKDFIEQAVADACVEALLGREIITIAREHELDSWEILQGLVEAVKAVPRPEPMRSV